MEKKIENKILENLSTIMKEVSSIKQELHVFKADTEKRFDAIDKKFVAIDKKFATNDKRFDTFEKELEAIKKPTLIMEHELTRKIDILLETRVYDNNIYQGLRVDMAKLNEITEMHSMQIGFIQNKCESKC